MFNNINTTQTQSIGVLNIQVHSQVHNEIKNP